MARDENLGMRGISPQPLILGIVAFLVAVTLVARSPDWSALLTYFLARFPQTFELIPHFDAPLFRAQLEMTQNLFARIMNSAEGRPIYLGPRPFSLGMRVKCIFLVAATDISVIVPTFNEEKYLPACLRSLARQRYARDYEVIVVDGGSTDRTVQIAEHFAARVVPAVKRPVGAARNEGARVARGKIVAFLDADTVACERWLTAIDEVFRDNRVIGATGPTLTSDGGILDSITYRFWTTYWQKMLLSMRMPHVVESNCAYRRSPFLKSGGFDETCVVSESVRLAQNMRHFGRIVFEKQMSALTSARRFRAYGRAYVSSIYFLSGFSTLVLKRPFTNYPPAR